MTQHRTDDELIAEALRVIKDNKLFFIEDISVYMGMCRENFYRRGLHKVHNIKMAILKNKTEAKQGLKAKWYKNDNATTQIALYKLLGSDKECHRLNGSKQEVDVTSGGEKIVSISPAMFVDTVKKEDIEKVEE